MQPVNPYQQNQVHTAPREDILLQLVWGAYIRAKQARELWAEGEKIKAREKRVKCFEIISYLDVTLNRENGGEIVEELEALYAYMIREISKASRYDDIEYLAPVEDVLHILHDGWKDAVAEYKKAQHQHKPLGGPSYGQAENYGDMRSYEGSR